MPLTLKDIQGSLTALDTNTTNVVDYAPSTADSSLTTYTLEDNYLRWRMPNSASEFTDPGAWKKINIIYSSLSTTQNKVVTFRRRNNIFTAITSWDPSWDPYSQLGSWRVAKVIIVNKTGAKLELDGSSFPPSNNILVS